MAGRRQFLGVPVDPIDMARTLELIIARLERGEPTAHLGINAANLVAARDDAEYLADLEAADLVTADGQSVVWGARLLGLPLPERVTGIDLMGRLLQIARDRGWSVYLLGARPSVVARLAGRLASSGVPIAGYRDGYLAPEGWPAAAEAVRASGARILFVGMPSPAKERFVVGAARPAGVPLSIGVGGSFDVLAGMVRRAPRWMQHAGLEWLFRLAQEPRRLAGRYLVTNTRFGWLLATSALARRRARRTR